mmetsp:Transcript_50250/g.90269  ORF Transcript_50250/g.90269 Transcript_50250/m.90269 type:complete len:313 (-) Transcript_50250:4707-5645(-)
MCCTAAAQSAAQASVSPAAAVSPSASSLARTPRRSWSAAAAALITTPASAEEKSSSASKSPRGVAGDMPSTPREKQMDRKKVRGWFTAKDLRSKALSEWACCLQAASSTLPPPSPLSSKVSATQVARTAWQMARAAVAATEPSSEATNGVASRLSSLAVVALKLDVSTAACSSKSAGRPCSVRNRPASTSPWPSTLKPRSAPRSVMNCSGSKARPQDKLLADFWLEEHSSPAMAQRVNEKVPKQWYLASGSTAIIASSASSIASSPAATEVVRPIASSASASTSSNSTSPPFEARRFCFEARRFFGAIVSIG